MARTPAGWYEIPGGGKRFWDGREWTPDVLGAPSKEAEYAGLAPDLAPPQTLVVPSAAPTQPVYAHQAYDRPAYAEPAYAQPVYAQPVTPPGWYPSPSGAMQWWDGRAWGPLAPPNTVVVRPAKESGIAYLFWFLLGGVAGHRFYLGLTASAVIFNLVWWGGWLLSPLLIGIPLVIAGGIWLLVDLFVIPSLVRSTNAARGFYR
ncbi:TM2 domain-containing protein [Microbacterium sp. SS28]|uniref:TM2 domain-containing protein n=1 Tax=Microbacterium sp. SS28 TaxID=2919948 RepID=UPI001FAA2B5A|nr:DUF2510 domain-containing protein [Microbacterium sp. SS28]